MYIKINSIATAPTGWTTQMVRAGFNVKTQPVDNGQVKLTTQKGRAAIQLIQDPENTHSNYMGALTPSMDAMVRTMEQIGLVPL